MTRLPWQHTRSRTKSGNEKSTLSHPQDWFSRSTAEPSRQAFTDLVKTHNRGKSNESTTTRSTSRPRTSTTASSHSRRHRSRSGLSEDEASSRPSSQGTMEHQTHPSTDRPDVSHKPHLSKSGIFLRRTSSILSLSSATSSSTLGLTSPPRSSRASSSASRTDEMRTKISTPFDFQHITHTEDTQFTALGRIDESSLADQCIATTTIPSTLSGTHDNDIAALAKQHDVVSPHGSATIVSATSSIRLPQTPPRPQPPPKDEKLTNSSSAAHHVVNEQSLESAKLMWLAAYTEHVGEGDQSRDVGSHISLDSKPLPELPLVHAITTQDNTAREMITSPLPSPPLPGSSTMETRAVPRPEPHRQHSSISLRYQNLYPSSKASMPNLLSAHHFLTAPKALARHHSDLALSQQAWTASSTTSTRTSMSFAAVDTMNWEDAVDEAWDDADGITSGTYLDESQLEIPLIESATSTPLMMTATSCGATKSPNRPSSSHTIEVHQLESVKEDEPAIDLTGLGISPCPASGTTSSIPRLSRSSSIHFSKRRSSSSCRGNDTLTRSSSQESIIMSIASSIGGTQRSSNSSVSAVDLTNMYNNQAEDCGPREHVEREDEHLGATRPESGCLPPDILEQLTQFGATFSADQASHNNHVPLASAPFQHNQSASRLFVPERRSSIVATSSSGSFRKRSNTWGNRLGMSSQPSYSLFPSTQHMSHTAVTTS